MTKTRIISKRGLVFSVAAAERFCSLDFNKPFTSILTLDHDPLIVEMDPDTIVLVEEKDQLKAFWLVQGKINCVSLPRDSVQQIPAPGKISKDTDLIKIITSKFGCTPYPDLLDEQRDIALQLSHLFTVGKEDVNPDEFKSYKYLTQGTSSVIVEEDLASAASIYYLFGLFTTLRLFLVRLNRVLSVNKIGLGFLQGWFAFLSFSYFLELFFDLAQTCKEAYQAMPQTELTGFARIKERISTFWRCFKVAFSQDPARKLRMFNAALWGPLNLFLFVGVTLVLLTFFPPAVFIVVNILGFTADVGVELQKKQDEVKEYEEQLSDLSRIINPLKEDERSTLHKINKLKHRKQELLEELREEKSQERKEKIIFILKKIDNDLGKLRTNLETIQQNLKGYTHQSTVIQNKINSLKSNRNREILLVSIILIGVVLYSIPGVNIPFFVLGASLAVGVSLYYAGRKLKNLLVSTYNYFKEKIKGEPEATLIPEPKNQLSSTKIPRIVTDRQPTISIPSVTRLPSLSSSIQSSVPSISRQFSQSSTTASPDSIFDDKSDGESKHHSRVTTSPDSPESPSSLSKPVLKKATTSPEVEEHPEEAPLLSREKSSGVKKDAYFGDLIYKNPANYIRKLQESITMINIFLTHLQNTNASLAQTLMNLTSAEIRELRRLLNFTKQSKQSDWNTQLFIFMQFAKNKEVSPQQFQDNTNRFFYGSCRAALEERRKTLQQEYESAAPVVSV